MIYLDYAATTPVMYEVLESYNKTTREYMGNVNSIHGLGTKSMNLLNNAVKQMAELLKVEPSELTVTSGATEGNNILIKGLANRYKKNGKTILVSKLEHPSVYEILNVLQDEGFKIEYLEHTADGIISFEDLKAKINKDTILVIVSALNSELGIREPIKTIKQIIKKENPNTFLHCDMTQAIGKVNVNLHDADSAVLSAHKFYGPKGIGLMYLDEKIHIDSIIQGSGKTNELVPGTPALPLIVAMAKALRISLTDLDHKEKYVFKLNNKLLSEFSKYSDIIVNNTCYSIPHFLNISINSIKPEVLINALSLKDIYIGTNTACSSEELSPSIMAIYNDPRRAMSSVRICLSHITTADEINRFINTFNSIYDELKGMK